MQVTEEGPLAACRVGTSLVGLSELDFPFRPGSSGAAYPRFSNPWKKRFGFQVFRHPELLAWSIPPLS